MENYSVEQIKDAMKAIGFVEEVIGNLMTKLREGHPEKSNIGNPEKGTAERRYFKATKRIRFRNQEEKKIHLKK